MEEIGEPQKEYTLWNQSLFLLHVKLSITVLIFPIYSWLKTIAKFAVCKFMVNRASDNPSLTGKK